MFEKANTLKFQDQSVLNYELFDLPPDFGYGNLNFQSKSAHKKKV